MLRKPPFGGVTIARADDELNHDKPVADHDVENVGLVDPQVTHDFYHAVAANPRFSDVEMSAYCEQFDGGAQTQFAAVTFRLRRERWLWRFGVLMIRWSDGRKTSTWPSNTRFQHRFPQLNT